MGGMGSAVAEVLAANGLTCLLCQRDAPTPVIAHTIRVRKAIGGINKVNPFDDIPNVPLIPKLAKGGIVTQPTLALIGEAGPEAVVPLNKMGGMGGVTINIEAGLVSTPDQVGQQIIEAIQRAQRRSGPAFAAA